MKRKSLLLGLFFTAATMVSAQNFPVTAAKSMYSKIENLQKSVGNSPKKVSIVVDELIEEVQGEAHKNLIRSGYSYTYQDGYVIGAWNDGFIGEYVMGDDGCIYIKNPFSAVSTNSYLKLEKVDDETYVAHSSQLVWVDYSDYTPFNGFATRLVYTKVNGQYTFQVEKDTEGNENTDMYFTLKDGVLSQKNQQTIATSADNSVPYEILGVTNAEGQWLGIGDGCMKFYASTEKPAELPATAVVANTSMAYNVLSAMSGKINIDAKLVECAEVGNDFYVKSPISDATNPLWIKGTIDREAGTVTFLPQYLGVSNELASHLWFRPASYNDWFDLIDEEDNYGEWVRDYTSADKYVLSYKDGKVLSDSQKNQTFAMSYSNADFKAAALYSNVNFQPYVEKAVTPSKPVITQFKEFNGMFGYVTFSLPPVDTENTYINTDQLTYRFFVDSEEPFTFDTKDYWKIPANMEEVPYSYADPYDFMVKSSGYHTVYFYEDWQYVGVQSIHRLNGEVNYSEIDWYNHTPTGLEKVSAEQKANINGKMIKDGKLIIIKNGKTYNAAGQRID